MPGWWDSNLQVLSLQDETYCIKTHVYPRACTGRNHFCYRCGMHLDECDCPGLGTLLDY
ncbi:MAG: hypothetical protein ACLQEQ_02900 [Nitrososphaerales archaeon]